ncbi:MAG: ankyrin repeat domain-containing protein [Alphaproteobacteria bacterium]
MSIGDEVETPGRDIPCDGDNALMFYAKRAGSHRKIFRLASEGHDLNARDDLERCSLILATVSHDVRNVLVLLRKGADLHSTDEGGDTPLHWAVYHKNADVARLLLKKGADMEKPNLKGQTPLQAALDDCHAPMVETFITAKTERLTAAFTKGTAAPLTVRLPLTLGARAKLKQKARKPL